MAAVQGGPVHASLVACLWDAAVHSCELRLQRCHGDHWSMQNWMLLVQAHGLPRTLLPSTRRLVAPRLGEHVGAGAHEEIVRGFEGALGGQPAGTSTGTAIASCGALAAIGVAAVEQLVVHAALRLVRCYVGVDLCRG